MTAVETEITRTPLQVVAFNTYRDIHKGIRAEIFAVTEEAGRIDPASDEDRAALSAHVGSVVDLLVSHAEHEDLGVQPALAEHLPAFAEQVAADHERLEARLVELRELAVATAAAASPARRDEVFRLYIELASFTGAYLAHQDFEERLVMPALEGAVGVDAVLAMHGAIIASIPPDEMVQSLAVMLPAMNVDDRAELLGEMRESAPAEVFDGVWGLAASVLTPADHAAVARRLDLS